jgi:hypothetical protein
MPQGINRANANALAGSKGIRQPSFLRPRNALLRSGEMSIHLTLYFSAISYLLESDGKQEIT